MNLLQAIEKTPWIGLTDLVKLTNQNKDELKEEIKNLLCVGVIIRIGKARGVKYAPCGTEEPERITDYKAAIISFMEERECRITRKMLVEHLKTSEPNFVPHLNALVDSGVVRDNGKKRGIEYWLGSQENDGVVFGSSENNEGYNSNLPPIKTIEELISLGIKSAKRGYRYDGSLDLARHIVESRPNHNFDTYNVSLYLSENWKTLENICVLKDYVNGWRFFFVYTDENNPVTTRGSEILMEVTA